MDVAKKKKKVRATNRLSLEAGAKEGLHEGKQHGQRNPFKYQAGSSDVG